MPQRRPTCGGTRRNRLERRLEQQAGEEHREQQLLRQMQRLDGVQRPEDQANDHQRDSIWNGQAPHGDRDRGRDAKEDDECAGSAHGAGREETILWIQYTAHESGGWRIAGCQTVIVRVERGRTAD